MEIDRKNRVTYLMLYLLVGCVHCVNDGWDLMPYVHCGLSLDFLASVSSESELNAMSWDATFCHFICLFLQHLLTASGKDFNS